MSFHVKDDFMAGAPVSQVPASWFNAVGAFLNNICGGPGIRVMRDTHPPIIALEANAAGGTTATENAYPTQSADKATVQASLLSADHWDAGVFTDVDGNVVRTDPNDASSAPKKTGLTFYGVTRSKKVLDVDYLLFRKFTVNENGLITAMSAEEFAVAVADESAL